MIDVAKLVADTIARDDEDTAVIEERHARNIEARNTYRKARIVRVAASILCGVVHPQIPQRLRGCATCQRNVTDSYPQDTP